MVIPLLPAEIIEDHIIDKLSNHIPSLKATALVSRAWLHASQKRLFSHIELGASYDVTGSSMCNKFNALLVGAPHIAGYVSHITIADGAESRRWMTQSRPSLSSIVPKLVNVSTVAIAMVSLPWREASSLRDILRGLFLQPKVRKIKLRGLNDLPGWDELFYMLNGSRTDHVLLYAVTLDPALSARASRRRRGPAIQRPRSTIGCLETNSSMKDLEDFAFWADNPKTSVDISNLPKFSFDVMEAKSLSDCNAVLQADAFRALDTFEVVVEDTANFEEATAQLNLSRVRHVQMTVREIPYSWAAFGDVLRWYTLVFETSRSDSIEEVTLTCVQWARVGDAAILDEWRALDRVLAQRIQNLRSVHLKTESEFPEDVIAGRAFLQDRVGDMFPVLHERGILHQA